MKWLTWRKSKAPAVPNGEGPPLEEASEAGSTHDLALRAIRGQRESLDTLIQRLSEIREDAERLLRDEKTKKETSDAPE
jgi:hypothetical protein